MDKFKAYKKEFGSVEYGRKEIALTQIPYSDIDTRRGPSKSFYAFGRDEEGNHYKVRWEITNHEAEKDSEACNWSEYEIELDYEDEWE